MSEKKATLKVDGIDEAVELPIKTNGKAMLRRQLQLPPLPATWKALSREMRAITSLSFSGSATTGRSFSTSATRPTRRRSRSPSRFRPLRSTASAPTTPERRLPIRSSSVPRHRRGPLPADDGDTVFSQVDLLFDSDDDRDEEPETKADGGVGGVSSN